MLKSLQVHHTTNPKPPYFGGNDEIPLYRSSLISFYVCLLNSLLVVFVSVCFNIYHLSLLAILSTISNCFTFLPSFTLKPNGWNIFSLASFPGSSLVVNYISLLTQRYTTTVGAVSDFPDIAIIGQTISYILNSHLLSVCLFIIFACVCVVRLLDNCCFVCSFYIVSCILSYYILSKYFTIFPFVCGF